MMTGLDVRTVVEAAHRAGLTIWLDGGWGIDALLGCENREHDDLDVVVETSDIGAFQTALAGHGYTVAEDHLPTRLVLRTKDGRQVDVHPVTFDAAGTGWQAGALPDGSDCPYPSQSFTTGAIEGIVVGCLTPDLQVEHHRGYEPTSKDRHDMNLLARAFGIDLPDSYASWSGRGG
jgi:lincosamide nucleotidyltransferase A/C/D/E